MTEAIEERSEADAQGARPSLRIPFGRFAVRWWVAILAVYAAARTITTIMLLVLASVQGRNPWTGPRPGYFDYASIWDGLWYKIIAFGGYPSTLPVTGGHVTENAWAFMPVYPFTVRGFMVVTALPWEIVSVFVSLICGFGAALLLYKILADVLDPRTALFAVVLFCVSPVSPLFQLAYAEALYMLLLALALLLLVRRQYVWLFPVVAVMALTRPSGLAFALCLGLHVIYRLVRRRSHPFPVRERILTVALTVFSAVAGWAWPAIAWAVTGSFSAYTDTELAWRVGFVGYRQLVPFAPWFQGGSWWLGNTTAGAIAVVALIVAFAVFLLTPMVRRLQVDLRIWVASYAIYLLAVFFPQSSVFRLLMPMFPLLGALAVPRSKVYRAAMIVLFLILQWVWLLICWGVDGSDWTPP